MWPVSAAAYDTLRSGHQVIASRVTAITRRHGRVASDQLPLAEGSGSVAYDANADVRSSCTVTIADPELWPGSDGFAVLSPYGSELFLERGIGLLDGRIEWVPLMVGPIVKPSRKRPDLSGVQVQVKDRAAWVKRARLFPGEQTISTNTIPVEIERLVRFALPDVEVIDRTGSDQQVNKMDLTDRDRWAVCRKMAASIAADVFFDRRGRLVIAPLATLDDDPVWTFDVGSRGVLVESSEEIDSDRFFNVFIASQTQNAAGSGTTPPPAPVSAVVTIDDPDDPLYVGQLNPTTGRYEGGNHPPVPRFFASPLITTADQAQRAAEGLRERCRGLGFSSGITALPNPLLDPGDVALVRYGDGSPPAAVILDAFEVALSADAGAQPFTLRGAPLPAEDDSTTADTTTGAAGVAEPAAAPEETVTVVMGTVSDAVWNQLRRAGYRGVPEDGQEALVGVPRSVYNRLVGIAS